MIIKLTVNQDSDDSEYYNSWWRMAKISNVLGLINFDMETISETGDPCSGTLVIEAQFVERQEQ